MKIKGNISFLLGASIPVLMIIFVVASIYIPLLFVKPKFNFLYVTGDGYYGKEVYFVKNDRLMKNENRQPEREPRLFIYDFASDKSREVTFEEAQELILGSDRRSSDGFIVAPGAQSGPGLFLFFFYTDVDYNSQYLVGDKINKKLNIQSGGSGDNNFRFLGWLEDKNANRKNDEARVIPAI